MNAPDPLQLPHSPSDFRLRLIAPMCSADGEGAGAARRCSPGPWRTSGTGTRPSSTSSSGARARVGSRDSPRCGFLEPFLIPIFLRQWKLPSRVFFEPSSPCFTPRHLSESAIVWERGCIPRTFPAPLPKRAQPHVMYSPGMLTSLSNEEVRGRGGDHTGTLHRANPRSVRRMPQQKSKRDGGL